MKIIVDISGEVFPVYDLENYEPNTKQAVLEVSEEKLNQWKESFKNFEETQYEIYEMLKNQNQEYWASSPWVGCENLS